MRVEQVPAETLRQEAEERLRQSVYTSPDTYRQARAALSHVESWMESPSEVETLPWQQEYCGCAGTAKDRLCLGCGIVYCASCRPNKGGAPCERCHGPIWGVDETRCPPRRHPQMKGF